MFYRAGHHSYSILKINYIFIYLVFKPTLVSSGIWTTSNASSYYWVEYYIFGFQIIIRIIENRYFASPSKHKIQNKKVQFTRMAMFYDGDQSRSCWELSLSSHSTTNQQFVFRSHHLERLFAKPAQTNSRSKTSVCNKQIVSVETRKTGGRRW